jgi:hypothetical protein
MYIARGYLEAASRIMGIDSPESTDEMTSDRVRQFIIGMADYLAGSNSNGQEVAENAISVSDLLVTLSTKYERAAKIADTLGDQAIRSINATLDRYKLTHNTKIDNATISAMARSDTFISFTGLARGIGPALLAQARYYDKMISYAQDMFDLCVEVGETYITLFNKSIKELGLDPTEHLNTLRVLDKAVARLKAAKKGKDA